jgi:hypothetical protein
MADLKFKRRIRDLFRDEFVRGPDEAVCVQDGYGESVHVEIVSHRFDGLDWREKQELIGSVMYSRLPPEEWVRISLTRPVIPKSNGRAANSRRAKRA